MAMTKERKYEIAYMLLKVQMSKNGVKYSSTARDIGNIVKEHLGAIGADEIWEFAEIVSAELHEETFGKRRKQRESAEAESGPHFEHP